MDGTYAFLRLTNGDVNLSVFFDSCLSSEHDHQSSGDRLLSADPHSIISEWERDKRFSCSSSERRLIGVNYLRQLLSLFVQLNVRLKTLVRHCKNPHLKLPSKEGRIEASFGSV
jgi:hypothetical protein